MVLTSMSPSRPNTVIFVPMKSDMLYLYHGAQKVTRQWSGNVRLKVKSMKKKGFKVLMVCN